MNRKLVAIAAAALIASGSAFAQSSNASSTKPATVNQRGENQQDRIANGVQSGQLTAGETKRLESREAGVNRQVRQDRAANGGKLTAQERRQITRQQNHLSKSIYADKHNGKAARYGNNEVGQRREDQQNRIANGIRSGSMTPGEAARTENREQAINQQVRADRASNGGKLTGQEKRQINREQNGTSRRIYRQKHNAAVSK